MFKKVLAGLVNKLENLPEERKKPNFCCLSITEDCILNCRMCFKWKKDISIQAERLSPGLSEWKNALTSIRNITAEGFLVNFGGGEPFLFGDILELVRFATQKGLKTNIPTNAFLIDEEMAKRIADSGLSMINISLDSASETTHDRIRGKEGVFKRVFTAIDLLHKYCPDLKKGICSVISELNLEDVVGLAQMVEKDDRLEWLYFMAVMQPNNTAPRRDWHKGEFGSLWPKDTERMQVTLDRLIEFKTRGYKIVNQVAQLKAFRSYFSDPDKFVKSASCNLSRAIHVSSVGDIYICFQHNRLGNIKVDDIEELWHSHEAEKVRQGIARCKRNCHFLLNCFFEGDFPFSF